jgi:hypothetical protein
MPIALRSDYDAARVRLMARESQDASQVRRLLALAAIYDGATRSSISRQRPKCLVPTFDISMDARVRVRLSS